MQIMVADGMGYRIYLLFLFHTNEKLWVLGAIYYVSLIGGF